MFRQKGAKGEKGGMGVIAGCESVLMLRCGSCHDVITSSTVAYNEVKARGAAEHKGVPQKQVVPFDRLPVILAPFLP